MPTVSIRTATAVRLVTILNLDADLAGATVTFGHPGEQLTGDTFVAVVLSPEGRTERANFKATRHQRDDFYTLEVHVALFGDDLDEYGATTSAACEALAGVVQGVIAEDPQLALDGSGLSGLVSAQQGSFSGPNLYRVGDGYVAECQLDITCHARLT